MIFNIFKPNIFNMENYKLNQILLILFSSLTSPNLANLFTCCCYCFCFGKVLLDHIELLLSFLNKKLTLTLIHNYICTYGT